MHSLGSELLTCTNLLIVVDVQFQFPFFSLNILLFGWLFPNIDSMWPKYFEMLHEMSSIHPAKKRQVFGFMFRWFRFEIVAYFKVKRVQVGWQFWTILPLIRTCIIITEMNAIKCKQMTNWCGSFFWHNYRCNVLICPDKMSLNVSISLIFSFSPLLPEFWLNNIEFDCNETVLPCRISAVISMPTGTLYDCSTSIQCVLSSGVSARKYHTQLFTETSKRHSSNSWL